MKTKTWVDPVVEEVRSWREDLAREAGYDIKRLGDLIMERQKRHGDRLVSRESRRKEA